MSRKHLICLFLTLTLLATAFIFGNSLKDGKESNKSSGKIVKIVEPIVDKLFKGNEIDVHFVVRKAAHIIEFALLGLVVSALAAVLKKEFRQSFAGGCLFYGLFAAVLDEFIQSFTGRTSMVRDVLIDFSGFLLGMLLAAAVSVIMRRRGKS